MSNIDMRIKSIQGIVRDFNEALQAWRSATSYEAGFRWVYTKDTVELEVQEVGEKVKNPVSSLEVDAVTHVVYRAKSCSGVEEAFKKAASGNLGASEV